VRIRDEACDADEIPFDSAQGKLSLRLKTGSVQDDGPQPAILRMLRGTVCDIAGISSGISHNETADAAKRR
jgi:hypothetical protein